MIDYSPFNRSTCRISVLVVFFALTLPLPNSYSQERTYQFELIGPDLHHASVVAEDSDGFIWVSSAGRGVLKYDGYELRNVGAFADTFKNIGTGEFEEVAPGKIWAGHKNGIVSYDKSTQRFREYAHDPDESQSLSGRVRDIFIDSKDRIWVATVNGIDLYRGNGGFIHLQAEGVPPEYDQSPVVHQILEGPGGGLWAASTIGLVKIDLEKKTFTPVRKTLGLALYCLYIWENERIWLGAVKNGLWTWDRRSDMLERVTLSPDSDEKDVRDMVEDKTGYLWVAISRAGLFQISPSGEYEGVRFVHDPADPGSLVSNRISDLEIDRHNNLWIATVHGLNRINFSNLIFPFYQHVNGWYHDRNSIFGSAFQDSRGGIWYDNAGEGHSYSPGLGKPAVFYFDRSEAACWNRNTEFLAEYDNAIWGLCRDQALFSLDLDTRTSRELILGDSLTAWDVRFFVNDSRQPHIIWFCTRFGLCRFNARTSDRRWFFPRNDLPDLLGDGLATLFPAGDGKLWTYAEDEKGVLVLYFDPVKEKFVSLEDQSYRQYLSAENLRLQVLHAQTGEHLWIGTSGGTIELDLQNRTSRLHDASGFLPEDRVVAITSDGPDDVWIITDRYINHYSTAKDSLLGSYYQGEIVRGFNYLISRQLLRTDDGRIVLPGTNGIIAFDPRNLTKDTTRPQVVLTDFKVLNQSRQFDRAIERVETIDLDYHDRSVTFEFAALHYVASDKLQYRYQLEGRDEDWIDAGFNRRANYSNLPPQQYTFRVRGASADGVWNLPEDDLVLSVVVHPIWYQTVWARSFFILLLLVLAYLAYRFQLNRSLAKAEAKRLRALDEIKTRLYTNITHEFRTPLTIILGMAGKIRGNPGIWLDRGLTMISRNGERLLRLVNQMLNLSKLESGKLKLAPVQGEVIAFLTYLTESFQSYAAAKDIQLHFLSEQDKVLMDYDPDKLTDIISNLLSNAVKFTPAGGDIYLVVRTESAADNGSEFIQHLLISIRDTGTGIPEDRLPHIFDRFYQIDDSSTRAGGGTGIGLALCRELVSLMNGSISVKSRLNKGTSFQIRLPVTREANLSEDLTPENLAGMNSFSFAIPPAEYGFSPAEVDDNEDLPITLVIEDHRDVTYYIASGIKDHFQVAVAHNGEEGIQKAIDLIPDVVICDVMMPGKDGFQVCATLKQDQRTSHIPIILLTARADAESRITGLRTGADAYLSKPFNEEELLVRLEQLIALRHRLKERYAGSDLPPPEDKAFQLEDAFLQRLTAVIEAHLDDAGLQLPEVCRAMQMSRSQIYRKLKALTGKSTTQFIRSYRLQRSKALLSESDLNVSEVAYRVGFSNLGYFTRCFKTEFGLLPSEWKNREMG